MPTDGNARVGNSLQEPCDGHNRPLTAEGRFQAGRDFFAVNIRGNRSGPALGICHAIRFIRQRNFNLLEE